MTRDGAAARTGDAAAPPRWTGLVRAVERAGSDLSGPGETPAEP